MTIYVTTGPRCGLAAVAMGRTLLEQVFSQETSHVRLMYTAITNMSLRLLLLSYSLGDISWVSHMYG